ncbi:MAG: orotidine-5'-phosphate decarboxylase [Selenomonadales bacterium]|jgi:orotidine-5'-phosphate decarboxylase|nr:orotidine-5'-phosphate decarboxylase [Selenomonadales bacterium]MBQ2113950.1 orotidine-5'-phosphate decarboxylase [Selenomonadales bacterium]MBQ2246351.1 orotidine-5'-phosphate decarboxylase [Selenomonadales bacterium]MBQ5635983.1 orotidine-5'-phosphate decarboxylase [Selenomonadales bacterium]MBQ5746110.1 orotidine-5'-phosphate decarboxylase [Selenomonadales bacterium]
MKDRLIVALDYSSDEPVKQLVTSLDDSVSYYKVGMELYYSVGESIIHYLKEQQKNVFLDLKLYDIPNTVAKGLSALTRLGANMMNVHASGGSLMMQKAVEAVADEAARLSIARPQVIAVTILTSMNQEQWGQMGHTSEISDQVVRLALLAKESGMDGVVASPQEASAIRSVCGDDFLIVTPGVRPVGAAVNDQSRIATPSSALRQGSTHLVVGRPITAAPDGQAAAKAILEEMEGAFK